eukprot:m.1459301 g.1459301  ORF g.1459301 m.1459301 type:complete len:643 (+) comp25126_c0_seq11:59-1987(+)
MDDSVEVAAAAAALCAQPGGAAVHESLVTEDQMHLLKHWDPENVAGINSFIDQYQHLDHGYPGGISCYLKNARKLLAASATGENPLEGLTPEIPQGVKLSFASGEFRKYEDVAVDHAHELAFVLVAGGLGERLGYGGIKVSLPSEITTGKCYLHLYIDTILALQDEARIRTGNDNLLLQFAIMTSGDTHDGTVALLTANNYFGMKEEQITLMKQAKVASLMDQDAHIAQDPSTPYGIATKPHGHGDVHLLLKSTGLARRWYTSHGVKWMLFFQDTNALIFKTALSAIGVSVTEQFVCNSIAGPRQAKREMGAIVRLRRSDGTSFTNNVEYNQLDAVLRDSGLYPDGDVAGVDGLSPFPGNMNQLIFNLEHYLEVLEGSEDTVPEFVNPKYADDTRTTFKKATRLECMMQDLPRQFKQGSNVGFTSLSGSGMTEELISQLTTSGAFTETSASLLRQDANFYTPVKNNKADASQKQRKGVAPSCASAGESDVYAGHCRILLSLGARIHAPKNVAFGAGNEVIQIHDWPHVVLAPRFSLTLAHVQRLCPTPHLIDIAAGSTLVVEGPGAVVIKSLRLAGALVVRSLHKDGSVVVDGLSVANAGMQFEALTPDTDADQVLRIRDYRLVTRDVCTVEHTAPTTLVIS